MRDVIVLHFAHAVDGMSSTNALWDGGVQPAKHWSPFRHLLSAIAYLSEKCEMQVALDAWKEEKWPKWLFLLDDNTWVNPISLPLAIQHLDPDEPYFIGNAVLFLSLRRVIVF